MRIAYICVWAAAVVGEQAQFDLSAPHEGLEPPPLAVSRLAEDHKGPPARHTEEPQMAMSVDEAGHAAALVETQVETAQSAHAAAATAAAADATATSAQAAAIAADATATAAAAAEAGTEATVEAGAEAAAEAEAGADMENHRHSHKAKHGSKVHPHPGHHASHAAAHHAAVHHATAHASHALGQDLPREHKHSRSRVVEGDTVEREADEVLHDYGTQREYERMQQIKRAAVVYERSKQESKHIAKKRKEVERHKAQLQKDLHKMEELKDAEATMIMEIKENQKSLHQQLFGAEELAAEQAKADAKVQLEYRHHLKVIALFVIFVAFASLMCGAYQSSKPASLGSAWLAPFKKENQKKEEESAASTDAAEAPHA